MLKNRVLTGYGFLRYVREQQVWQVGIQPGGPWPRRLKAEIRIIGFDVVLVYIVEYDFPGPILVLQCHYTGVPCTGIRWIVSIFEEAFYPSPFSDLRSAGSQALEYQRDET
jgi:hypothetical protein